jgi:hypothetical protein
MNTKEIMQLALDLVGFKEIPCDSEIYVDGDNIRRIAIGIDMGVPELLLAKQLGCDCVIAHHPQGDHAVVNFAPMVLRHVDFLTNAGAPHYVAEKVVQNLYQKSMVNNHMQNYDHKPSIARLLKMPYLNIHNPCDELGRRTMQNQIDKSLKSDSTVADVINCLMELPEFQKAITKIELRVGKPTNLAGKVVVVHGGGTNGGYEIAKTYYQYGIATVIYIHIYNEELTKLQADNIGNLIITGHIASDAVGINPFIHELEKRGLEVIRMSGL